MKCPNGWGSRFGYANRGCRCEQCTKAQARYVREYRRRDPDKHRRKNAQWRQENPEKVLAYTSRYRRSSVFQDRIRERLEWFNQIKLQRGCVDCGYNKHPAALHFDHVRGTKSFLVGARKLCSRERMIEEMSKCEVRCANCHAIRTMERRQHGS